VALFKTERRCVIKRPKSTKLFEKGGRRKREWK
jgi:hypothetical protein